MKKGLLKFLLGFCAIFFITGCELSLSFDGFTSMSSQSSITIKSDSNSSQTFDESRTINLFAMNDFHGAINQNGEELGILKQGTFFKQKGQEENTLIINSGDMWQGSIDSNYNYGELLTKVMNNIEFDCFVLGNHEFDWGDKYIKKNRELSDEFDNYKTPFLAANIYDFDIESKTTYEHADELGDKYVIKELENGVKVGIIGTIGQDQITSITSQYVDAYTFLDPTPIIKGLSDELRVEKGCDIVVLSSHASIEQIIGDDTLNNDYEGITSISSISKKRYVDAVFGAHSHQYQNYMFNNVPFVQASSNGKSYAEIVLELDKDGNVNCIKRDSHQNNVSDISSITSYDQEIVALVNEYKSITDPIGEEILGNLNGNLYSSGNVSIANLVVASIADIAESNNIDIDYAISNGGRSTLYSGEITYAELYKSIPFDNIVYIVEVLGSDIIRQASYDSTYIYRVNSDAINSNETYTLAVLDYLALHRNSNRIYNYYPSAKIKSYFTKDGYDIYNYRDITADYIRKTKNIIASNYNSSLINFNGDLLSQPLESDVEIDPLFWETSFDVKEYSYLESLVPNISDETNEMYYLIGQIFSITNTKYGNCYVQDQNGNSLYVYGLYDKNGLNRYEYMSNKPSINSVVVLRGIMKNYDGLIEMVNGRVVQLNGEVL